MTITIKTYLDENIYQSSGGGQVTTHYEWKTGPLNLLRAAGKLPEHQLMMTRCYGNRGHGSSWIEINGKRVSKYDLDNLDYGFCKMVGDSRMSNARELIREYQ